MMANPRTSDSFTLLFRAPRELPPFTTIYVIEHPVLGKFDLFLKRAGADVKYSTKQLLTTSPNKYQSTDYRDYADFFCRND